MISTLYSVSKKIKKNWFITKSLKIKKMNQEIVISGW